MTFRHVFVSLACTCLVACSSDDTIVSLNVTATDRVPVVDRIEVTFKQGSRTFAYEFAPPNDISTEPDGISSVRNGFFERITLPGDWDEADAQISVEAFQEGGDAFEPALTDDTTVKLEPEGVVAAYVELDIPEPPPMGGAGGEGAGGAAGEGGAAAGAGGALTDGGVPNDAGGMPSTAGAAGDTSSGGVGGAG